MKFERVFRIAPSIVRVLLKERPATTNVVEGYLPERRERTQFIRLEANGCHLLLQRTGDQEKTEERTKLPIEQAEALLDASTGPGWVSSDASSHRGRSCRPPRSLRAARGPRSCHGRIRQRARSRGILSS